VLESMWAQTLDRLVTAIESDGGSK
jgi:hypothetical protein